MFNPRKLKIMQGFCTAISSCIKWDLLKQDYWLYQSARDFDKDSNGILYARLLTMLVPMLVLCTWSNQIEVISILLLG